MSKLSDYLSIMGSFLIQVVFSFFAGEYFWIFIISIIAESFMLVLYHYTSKDELNKKWEMKRR